jgi:AmmeMemoRadiSam system radical SAM enzyme/AmmeMemoRadiSam system protein B/AmmeMemoRadiSam system protein A
MNFELPTVRESTGGTADGMLPGKWWHKDDKTDRVICDLCPRECAIKDGDRGFCFVRQNVGGQMMLTTYGRSTGFCIDPIEKKPLNHFYPGTSVLSFGTAGCNLGCKFCQNWDISKAREVERLSHRAFPEEIALAAKSLECHSVAYTYNDPIVWAEYAIETAKACRQHGVKSVAVTAGYVTEEARGPFFEYMDAANVDLKAFTEEFYYKITYAHLEPILDTLKWLRHETDVWFEITNLIIPDANDKPDEIRKMAEWVLGAVGDDVPVHFSAFHPDFRMTDRPKTPHETLILAHDLATQTGLKHVYVGNVNDVERQSTYCPNCKILVIERNWYELGVYALEGNQCRHCGHEISGKYEDRPGHWGRKRQPVDMKQFHIDGLSAGSDSRLATNGDTMNADKNQQSSDQANNGDVKINDSALQWLAGQGDDQNAAPTAPAPVPVHPQTPAPATQPIPTRMPLTNEQREAIRIAAAEVVKACVDDRNANIPNLVALGVGNAVVSGIFVSLKRQGRLRSCMGSFGATMPLQKTLIDAARRTATDDPRFPPVSSVEVPYLELEVWLLFAPEPVNVTGEARIAEVTIGTHGLQIVRGNQRGLLLPGVATDNGWGSEEFLDNVCVKAGMPPTAWKEPDTILFRFEGNCIKGGLLNGDADQYATLRLTYTPEQLEELRRICHDNVTAIVRGATPMYYCGTVPDSSVSGITLTVTLPGGGDELNVVRMSIREPMPLQSTAFSMCEELAASLRRRGFLNGNFELNLAIVSDPSMHGTVDQPMLEGVDTVHRGILINERQKNAWVFDREKTPTEVLADTMEACQLREPAFGMIYSLTFQSTRSRVSYAAVPKPSRGGSDRAPAVAGRFYPADPGEMNRMLDDMLAGEATPELCKAVMVPHAGWQFSGRLAADVLKRVRIPKRIIAIGPKHTPHGTDWAVAPHHNWLLPEKHVASDYALAMKLAEKIDGLEADANAHKAEHGIEVELPIIARLAPETQVVGLTIGGGNLERCEQFATQLAEVIRELDEPPLLLISSDMNHYANDEETRRLDTLALADLDRLDEDAMFNTCRSNHISMCGMIPAVMILKTLKKLGSVHQSRQIGYTTSAEQTGDTSKVVGYAGRVFQ